MEAAAAGAAQPGRTPVRHPARRLHAAGRRGLRARRRPSCSSRSSRPTSSSTRRRPAARRRASSPGARSPACRRAVIGISADESVGVARPRRSGASSTGSTIAARRADAARSPDAPIEVDDRLRRRRLRRADAGSRPKRSSSSRGRGDLPRSDLHRQGDGRPDRARARRRFQRRRHGALLAHGGQVALFVVKCKAGEVSLR